MPADPTAWLFGMATAAEQVEGDIVGTDWELFSRDPGVARRVQALMGIGGQPPPPTLRPPGHAAREGHLDVLRADLDAARLLGANAFRFSIEWARLEPRPGEWRQDVLESYYLRVIAELRARGMEPVVTLQHFSLPSWVLTPPTRTRWAGPIPFASAADPGYRRSLRGWESQETVDAYAAYVARLAPVLRDAGVRWWIPLNEPTASVVGLGYLAGVAPPGFTLDARRALTAHLNLLRAHVRACDVIKACAPDAMVGVAHAMLPYRPLGRAGRRGQADERAAAQADYFFNLHLLDSLVTGRVDTAVDLLHPRPVGAGRFFGTDEAPWRPRLDFVGVNYYRPLTIRWHPLASSLARVAGGLLTPVPVPVAGDNGSRLQPDGLFEILTRVAQRYRLPMLVTENGLAERADRLRAPHLVGHLEAVERARAAGADVRGFLYWSLVDNWEWSSGYDPNNRFGLVSIDFSRPEQPRALTEGALAFRHVALGGPLSEARARYGTIAGDGSCVQLPRLSPGRLCREATPDGDRLVHLTVIGGRVAGLVFEPETGRWRAFRRGEWRHLGAGLVPDWREGVFVAEDRRAPFRALHLTAVSRWEIAGPSADRWLARIHDGVTWQACDCRAEGPSIELRSARAIELRLEGDRLLALEGGWALRRLPDLAPALAPG